MHQQRCYETWFICSHLRLAVVTLVSSSGRPVDLAINFKHRSEHFVLPKVAAPVNEMPITTLEHFSLIPVGSSSSQHIIVMEWPAKVIEAELVCPVFIRNWNKWDLGCQRVTKSCSKFSQSIPIFLCVNDVIQVRLECWSHAYHFFQQSCHRRWGT